MDGHLISCSNHFSKDISCDVLNMVPFGKTMLRLTLLVCYLVIHAEVCFPFVIRKESEVIL